MSDSRRRLGRLGEAIARRRLQELGYRIVDANYRAPSGEIDLVAEHDGALVCVEVRTRSGRSFGQPEESITPRKRSHMVDSAREYLQTSQAGEREWRIDLVEVEVGPNGRLKRIDVLENAIEL